MNPPTIVLEIDGQTVTRQPPPASKCATCKHLGDFVTGAEWCIRHNQVMTLGKDDRMIVTACNGHEVVGE